MNIKKLLCQKSNLELSWNNNDIFQRPPNPRPARIEKYPYYFKNFKFMLVGHKKQWDFLSKKFGLGQLAHAYLFSGEEKIGKKNLAKEFTKLINCLYYKSEDSETCSMKGKTLEQCQNCKMIEKEMYPDLLVVKSAYSESSVKNEKDMMEIDVSQIRQVNNFLSYTSYYGGYKTVIIDNAELMNQEAQSCFLKTLEEPKGKTIIILITKNSELLLPTIFSRCQTVVFSTAQKYAQSKEEQDTLQELLGIINSELAVKFQHAKKVNLEEDNFNTILKILQRYFRNTMLEKIGVIKNQSANNPTTSLTERYTLEKLRKVITLIETLYMQAAVSNINSKLALEVLLMEI
ncbi:MAG: DNA polymerase III subunit [Patescibacteria group bacterium]